VGEQQFRKYQWVHAKIDKNSRDSRPESYKIQNKSIRVGEFVETEKGWSFRSKMILSNRLMFLARLRIYNTAKALTGHHSE
jgi:hypothetical protein